MTGSPSSKGRLLFTYRPSYGPKGSEHCARSIATFCALTDLQKDGAGSRPDLAADVYGLAPRPTANALTRRLCDVGVFPGTIAIKHDSAKPVIRRT